MKKEKINLFLVAKKEKGAGFKILKPLPLIDSISVFIFLPTHQTIKGENGVCVVVSYLRLMAHIALSNADERF